MDPDPSRTSQKHTDPQHCLVEDRHIDGVLGVKDGEQEDVVGPLVGIAACQLLLHLHIRRHIRFEANISEYMKRIFIRLYSAVETNIYSLIFGGRSEYKRI
jgi:hypothetical protein